MHLYKSLNFHKCSTTSAKLLFLKLSHCFHRFYSCTSYLQYIFLFNNRTFLTVLLKKPRIYVRYCYFHIQRVYQLFHSLFFLYTETVVCKYTHFTHQISCNHCFYRFYIFFDYIFINAHFFLFLTGLLHVSSEHMLHFPSIENINLNVSYCFFHIQTNLDDLNWSLCIMYVHYSSLLL